MNNAHFASEGIIRELLIWDTVNYRLGTDPLYPKYGIFAPVYKRNKELIDNLGREMRNPRLNIFFKAGRMGENPTEPSLINNVRFVAVNHYDSKAFVPTAWVQDVLVIAGEKVIWYDEKRVNAGLRIALEEVFKANYDFKPVKCLESGGNLQLIRTQRENAHITGMRNADGGKIPVAKKRINLGSKVLEAYNKQTFHLDYYFHWLGSSEKIVSKDTSLTPVHYYLRGTAYRKSRLTNRPVNYFGLNAAISTSMLELEAKLLPNRLHEINVPVILIPQNQVNGKKNKDYYSLTYTNCHVERIEDTDGTVRFHIYFPDFTYDLKRLIFEACVNGKEDILRNISDTLHAALLLFCPEVSPVEKTKKAYFESLLAEPDSTIEEFIIQMHAKLEKTLALYPVTPHFIKSGFQYLAQRFGSLHCMSKVMERY